MYRCQTNRRKRLSNGQRVVFWWQCYALRLCKRSFAENCDISRAANFLFVVSNPVQRRPWCAISQSRCWQWNACFDDVIMTRILALVNNKVCAAREFQTCRYSLMWWNQSTRPAQRFDIMHLLLNWSLHHPLLQATPSQLLTVFLPLVSMHALKLPERTMLRLLFNSQLEDLR